MMSEYRFFATSIDATYVRILNKPVVVIGATRSHRECLTEEVEIRINGLDRDQATRLVAGINWAMGEVDAVREYEQETEDAL